MQKNELGVLKVFCNCTNCTGRHVLSARLIINVDRSDRPQFIHINCVALMLQYFPASSSIHSTFIEICSEKSSKDVSASSSDLLHCCCIAFSWFFLWEIRFKSISIIVMMAGGKCSSIVITTNKFSFHQI